MVLYGWSYKAGTTVHYLLYYYNDNFTTVCINEMIGEKIIYYQQYIRLFIHVYPVGERQSVMFSEHVTLHPYSVIMAIVCTDSPGLLS